MARKIFCKKYQQELDGLKAPPYPGPKGQELYETVSQRAWDAWIERQTMLINEKKLNLRDKESRNYLTGQMGKFFNNEQVDEAEGYVPPSLP
jgi:Fe-S cluster biosynthesis and repair protein YggX